MYTIHFTTVARQQQNYEDALSISADKGIETEFGAKPFTLRIHPTLLEDMCYWMEIAGLAVGRDYFIS